VEHFRWRDQIGIGFPGVIQGPHIRTAANMHPGFIGLDGEKLFSKATRCQVALINDAAAAGLAEMEFGAGRGFKGKALLLTLGTGVGSVLFHRGVIFPCELGHLPLPSDGKDAEKHVAASVRKKKNLSWSHWGRRLSEYLSILETILWPELIILGGGVSARYDKYFKYLKVRTKIVPAEFFNGAGIVGAALWGAQVGNERRPALDVSRAASRARKS
ncbi:MAG: ROK family protein, partial [Verrucomicrobiota bacterium]|nr:ROK family protein [Verrucomicrobiota bacterium]